MTQRALVIQMARFGDLIQSKRLVRTVLAQGYETHLLVDHSLLQLAHAVYPECEAHAINAHGAAKPDLGALQRIFHELKTLDFTRVYNLNYSGLSFATSALFPGERVRGYRQQDGQALRGGWMDLAFRWTRRRQMSPINLVDFWGGLAESPVAAEQVNPAATPKGGGLGVVLSGRNARRSLPPEALVSVILALRQRLGAKRVVLLGSSAEQSVARDVNLHAPANLQQSLVNLAGKTDWSALIEEVGGLDLLLTPDTGTMHLAAHLGTPVEAVFLASAWTWETGPYGAGHRVWQSLSACSPCVESQPCSCGLECLTPFTSREFLRMLATGKENAPPEFAAKMLGLETSFDALGQAYSPFLGEDPWAATRRGLRALLAERLGQVKSETRTIPPTDRNELAQKLYAERDWMLP